MVRATYQRKDGSTETIDSPSASCADHRASVDHSYALQRGLVLLTCEVVSTGGVKNISRVVPTPTVDPESYESRPLGVSVDRVRRRRI